MAQACQNLRSLILENGPDYPKPRGYWSNTDEDEDREDPSDEEEAELARKERHEQRRYCGVFWEDAYEDAAESRVEEWLTFEALEYLALPACMPPLDIRSSSFAHLVHCARLC